MNDRAQTLSTLQRWSRLPAAIYMIMAIASFFYVRSMTSGQPKDFYPLEIRETDSSESRSEANSAWRKKHLPSNISALINCVFTDHKFVQMDPIDFEWTFKEQLLSFNQRAAFESRSYWQVARHLQMIGVVAFLTGLFAIWKLQLFTSFVLLIIAVCGMPFSFWLFGGPLTYEIASLTYWFYSLLLIPSLAYFALAGYRWRLAPVTKELKNDWQMVGLGIVLLCIGVGAFASLVAFGGRVRGAVGILIFVGAYLIGVHGWKIVRFYFLKKDEIPEATDTPNTNT